MNRKEDGKKTTISIICNSITSLISILVSLITTIVITRIISVSDLGIATSFITLKNILTIVCLLSIYISINRMMLDVKNSEFEYLSSIYIFSSFVCILMYILYFIFHKYLNVIFGFDLKMMTLMFTMIFLINGCTLLINYWNFKNKYKLSFIYNLLASPVSQICSLIFAYLLSNEKYLGRIIGVDLFNILFGIGCGIYILKKGKFKFKEDYIRQALKICVPMIPHLLAQILLSSCDLLMIRNIAGNNSAGIYSMAYTISNILYTVLIQLMLPWSPWVYRRLKSNEIEPIKNNSTFLFIGSWYLCLGLFTIAPEMIKIFLSQSYYEASYIIAPICVGIFFQIVYIFFYDIEYYYKKNKQIAFFSVITSILNIILNYIFIKRFGYIAAAYTTLISYLILAILHYFGMKKIEKRKMYNINKLVGLSILLVVILFVYILSHNNIIIRYSLFSLVSIIIIFRYIYDIKKFVLKLIKKEKKVYES